MGKGRGCASISSHPLILTPMTNSGERERERERERGGEGRGEERERESYWHLLLRIWIVEFSLIPESWVNT